jgi:hypothetical protein
MVTGCDTSGLVVRYRFWGSLVLGMKKEESWVGSLVSSENELKAGGCMMHPGGCESYSKDPR